MWIRAQPGARGTGLRRSINSEHRDGDGPGSVDDPQAGSRRAIENARRAVDTDQTTADADQSAADADQTLADADQTASAADQASAESDQRASDHDQDTADRDRAAGPRTPAEQRAYDDSRDERERASFERLGNRLKRANTAVDRDTTATERDRTADARDEFSRARESRAAREVRGTTEPDASVLHQMEGLRAQAAADRARAAADRARAAADRADAARERARLEAELHSAHLDDLTGAYRREMGRLALSHEIDRAQRSDGRFVVAFVDVDGLKTVNDRDGHSAGDRVLQAVVRAIRMRLRSFDPVIRFGGDEFVCGIGGTDLVEAERRFEAIRDAVDAEAHVGISVGLAALASGETADQLIDRADAAMLAVRTARAGTANEQ
jgi:diguanylate cyclase (GGDEF)-like protein